MQFKKLLFFIISITIIFSGCDSKNETKEEKQVEVKKEVVEKKQNKFVLQTQDATILNTEILDKQVHITELKGKVFLLNFWATWCPPCKVEIPHLINLKNKYKDSFEVVAINVGEKGGRMTSTEKLNDFMNEYKINYIVTNTEENLKVADAMGNISVIPTMFLIGKEGNIIQKYVGVVPPEMIETDIKKALGK